MEHAARSPPGTDPDLELLYVGAMFLDLGLTAKYRRVDQRFELDGADAVQTFLLGHGYSQQEARNIWLGIALHTTPGVPDRMEPKSALLSAGAATDVIGAPLGALTTEEIAAVIAACPRTGFTDSILHALYTGMKHPPATTFDTINDDILAHFDPKFSRTNLVTLISGNDLPR